MKPREIITIGETEIHFCLDAGDTGKMLTMYKCVLPAAAKMPLQHYHEGFDETVYGLEGTVTYTVDGKTMDIGAGDALFIPRGAVHGFVNRTGKPAVFLGFFNPGALGPDYFHDIVSVMPAGGTTDSIKLKEVMQKHGVVAVEG